DAIARWRRMSGCHVSWIPGTDHAGIGTQSVVERKLLKETNLTRHDLGRQEFVEEIWKWRSKHGDRIISQLRRLGASLDWDKLFFTMDAPRSQAVTNAFLRLYQDGLIYRDTRLVNWCCALETVISDIEVDYETVSKQTMLKLPGRNNGVEFGVLHKVAYPVADESIELKEVVVATTRIETILGDVAVAVHPEDPRYKALHGKEVIHPLLNKRVPIVCDAELVDLDFGTGVVKLTPAHDPNDYNCARRHNLPLINIFNKNGTFNENCGIAGLVNKDRFDSRQEIIDRLVTVGCYRGKDVSHEMRIGRCSRTGDVIEPLLQPQWYIRCKDLANRALQAAANGELTFEPAYHIKEWNHWLENIQDWCISRQLWWGHSIPAFQLSFPESDYDAKSTWIIAKSKDEAESLAKTYIRSNSMDINIPYILKQDEDVLDTWFSSGLLPLSALNWTGNDELPAKYPTSMIESGFDILFFWIARMTMLCTYFAGKPPFKNILLHAMVRDVQGRKMSKSLGNVIDPLDVIDGITLGEMKQVLHESSLPHSEIKRSETMLSKEYPQGIPACGTDALRFSLVNFTEH
ncbi:2231_t:CDS:10, partial [Paraglomus occultum]